MEIFVTNIKCIINNNLKIYNVYKFSMLNVLIKLTLIIG